eukprot:m.113109 g.113109  ORF g.113109 m.113109 type:complete len:951 (+) comp9261_c0_seq4:145-2997(+)
MNPFLFHHCSPPASCLKQHLECVAQSSKGCDDCVECCDSNSELLGTKDASFLSSPQSSACLVVDGERGESLRVSMVKENIFRVSFLPDGERRVSETFIIVNQPHPNESDPSTLQESRNTNHRDALFCCKQPASRVDDVDGNHHSVKVSYGDVAMEGSFTEGEPVGLKWSFKGKKILCDLPSGSYASDVASTTGQTVRHYLSFNTKSETCYGIGEAAGRVNRNGMRVRLSALDAMGYSCDASKPVSDPLYKHFPIVYTHVRDEKTATTVGWVGALYDSGAQGVMDIGCEVSAFRGSYRYTEFQDGDMEYYLVFGQNFKEVVMLMTELLGRPIMSPRWCLGYLGSTMAYTEASNAQEQLKDFATLCNQHSIPCDGFHLSSGYTCVDNADGTFGSRCVFHWNHRRVPNPVEMFNTFNKASISVIPNIKPWLLMEDHPLFEDAVKSNVCLQHVSNENSSDTTDLPHLGLFWSGGGGTFKKGAYVDFSGEEGFEWWVQQCRKQLLEKGAHALWNDNNEFEVSDTTLICRNGLPMSIMRPVQALLMAKASEKALLLEYPMARPVVVTRSGSPGMHRHCVQTWSGDNFTSWETLQWNTSMSLSLSVCGWPGCGYDVGGFAGEMPEEELLLRWVQSAVFMPRFSIHSWNFDNTCTEPWSYPESTDSVRGCIQTRYQFIPHLYNLYFEAHRFGLPIIRPLVFEFPDDPFVAVADVKYDGDGKSSIYLENASSCDFMFGPSVLVCPIYQKGDEDRPVYLPGSGCKWWSAKEGVWKKGGNVVNHVSCAPSDDAPIYFVKNNSIIATTIGKPTKNTGDLDQCGRCFTIFNTIDEEDGKHAESSSFSYSHMEDDGISINTMQYLFNFEVTATSSKVDCHVSVSMDAFRYKMYNEITDNMMTVSSYALPFSNIILKLARGDTRKLIVNLHRDGKDGDGKEKDSKKAKMVPFSCDNGCDGTIVYL